MKKKYVKIFLPLLCVSMLAGFAACAGSDNDGGGGGVSVLQPGERQKLTIADAEMALLVGDEVYLDVAYDVERGDTLTFTVSNPDVLSVDDLGKCVAKKCGEAVVTVRYGEEVATASVTVGIGDKVPVLMVDAVKDGKIKIGKSDAFDFAPYVVFNEKTFAVDQFTVTLSDESVGFMEGSVFHPTSVGTTQVQIEAQWAGIGHAMLTKTFEVETVTSVELYVNDGKQDVFTLYAISSFAGNSYETEGAFVVRAYENDQPLETSVEILSGAEFVDYDEQAKTIRSKGVMGEAEILVSCVYDQDDTYQKRFRVNVLPSIAKYEAAAIEFETMIGELPLRDIFGEDVTLYGAQEYGTPLEIKDNKVLGVTPIQEEVKEITIRVYTQACGFDVSIIPYSRIIRTVEDLEEIFRITEIQTEVQTSADVSRTYIKSATVFDGYYVLGGNIDASGYTHRVTDNTLLEGETESKVAYKDGSRIRSKLNKVGAEFPLAAQGGGLTGTFDGRGYTIFNLTVEDHGLFGLIYGGTVKDVGFQNVTIKGSAYQENKALFAEQSVDGTFTNVYVKANTLYGGDSTEDVRADNDARGSRALLAVSAFGKTSVKDSFFIYEIASTTIKYCYSYGLFAYEGSLKNVAGSTLNFENVYVITNSALISTNPAKVYKTTNSSVLLAENDLTAGVSDEEKENRIYEIVGKPNHDANMPWGGDDQYNGKTFLSHLSKQATGVFRYESETEMLEAGHDFSHFSNHWIVLEGYLPCFESTGLEPAQEVEGEFLFDTQTGEFSASQLSEIFGKTDVDIQSAKFEQTDLTVKDNKITGFPIDRHGEKLSVIIKLQGVALGYKVTVIPVTEYLDDIEDIERIFKITNVTLMTQEAGYIESATSFEGYYVLKCDIDASGYTHQVVEGTARENMKTLTHLGKYAQNGGLKGIFDGNGHTISNLTVGHHGLFGLIYGGTVRNVGFTNVTLKGDTNEENLSFLAEQMIDATLENVYIQAAEIVGGNGTTPSNQSRGNRVLLAMVAYGNMRIVNSVFQYNIEGTQKQYARTYGLIGYEHVARYNALYPSGSSIKFENVYVISNAMISSWNTSGQYKTASSMTLAENETNETGLSVAEFKALRQEYVYEQLGGANNTNITKDTINKDNIYRYEGIYRYATVGDMQKANNDYSDFKSENWDIVDGEIIWKA